MFLPYIFLGRDQLLDVQDADSWARLAWDACCILLQLSRGPNTKNMELGKTSSREHIKIEKQL